MCERVRDRDRELKGWIDGKLALCVEQTFPMLKLGLLYVKLRKLWGFLAWSCLTKGCLLLLLAMVSAVLQEVGSFPPLGDEHCPSLHSNMLYEKVRVQWQDPSSLASWPSEPVLPGNLAVYLPPRNVEEFLFQVPILRCKCSSSYTEQKWLLCRASTSFPLHHNTLSWSEHHQLFSSSPTEGLCTLHCPCHRAWFLWCVHPDWSHSLVKVVLLLRSLCLIAFSVFPGLADATLHSLLLTPEWLSDPAQHSWTSVSSGFVFYRMWKRWFFFTTTDIFLPAASVAEAIPKALGLHYDLPFQIFLSFWKFKIVKFLVQALKVGFIVLPKNSRWEPWSFCWPLTYLKWVYHSSLDKEQGTEEITHRPGKISTGKAVVVST